MRSERLPFGVIGVFLALLGAGLILDGNRIWSGSFLIVAGSVCLLAEWRKRPPRAETPR